jgi:hypothetical protein
VSAPLSVRFDPGILDHLRSRARAVPGATPSGLAQRLVDEGLRMAEHPGIAFKDGPTGRRASLQLGPDVWEVVKTVRELDERGEAAVLAAADLLSLSREQARVGPTTGGLAAPPPRAMSRPLPRSAVRRASVAARAGICAPARFEVESVATR